MNCIVDSKSLNDNGQQKRQIILQYKLPYTTLLSSYASNASETQEFLHAVQILRRLTGEIFSQYFRINKTQSSFQIKIRSRRWQAGLHAHTGWVKKSKLLVVSEYVNKLRRKQGCEQI